MTMGWYRLRCRSLHNAGQGYVINLWAFDGDDAIRRARAAGLDAIRIENEQDTAIAGANARIAALEAGLTEIAAGHVDSRGNRRNHFRATSIARELLGIADR